MVPLVFLGAAALLATKGAKKVTSKPEYNKFDSLFQKYANDQKIDWKMMKAISMNESSIGTNPKVKKGIDNPNDVEGSKSSDGKSWGLMQLTLATASDFDKTVTPQKLNNPEYSIRIASMFIRSLARQFDKERDIVMAYNQGAGNQNRFIQLETAKVLTTSQFPAAREYWNRYQTNKKELGL